MNIRPTARVVLFNKDNQVLLLKMKIGDDLFWLTPGGKIEDGETAFNTAKRELFEETGINEVTFLSDSHVFYYEHVDNCNGKPTFFKEHIFVAYAQNTNVTFDNLMDYEKNEISGFVWWDIAQFIEKKEELFPKNLAEDIQTFIHQNLTVNTEKSIVKEI